MKHIEGTDTYHKLKDGRIIRIAEMSDEHLLNTIRLLLKKSTSGVTIRQGGGTCAEDMWYDEVVYYDQEALELLNYQAYVDEAKKRNKNLSKKMQSHDTETSRQNVRGIVCRI